MPIHTIHAPKDVIHADTYQYIQIYTYTYTYIHIHAMTWAGTLDASSVYGMPPVDIH